MTRDFLAKGEKPLFWVGSSRKDLEGLPVAVKRKFGLALSYAQRDSKYTSVKPWKGDGPGVLEIVEEYRGDAYRSIYTVRFEKAVYVLYVFQKKSKTGIKTDRGDQDLVASRLRDAQRYYGEEYG